MELPEGQALHVVCATPSWKVFGGHSVQESAPDSFWYDPRRQGMHCLYVCDSVSLSCVSTPYVTVKPVGHDVPERMGYVPDVQTMALVRMTPLHRISMLVVRNTSMDSASDLNT